MWKYLAALLVVLLSMGGLVAADTQNSINLDGATGMSEALVAANVGQSSDGGYSVLESARLDLSSTSTFGPSMVIGSTEQDASAWKSVTQSSAMCLDNKAGGPALTESMQSQTGDAFKVTQTEALGAKTQGITGTGISSQYEFADGSIIKQGEIGNTFVQAMFGATNAGLHSQTAIIPYVGRSDQDVLSKDTAKTIFGSANVERTVAQLGLGSPLANFDQGNVGIANANSWFGDASVNDKVTQDIIHYLYL